MILVRYLTKVQELKKNKNKYTLDIEAAIDVIKMQNFLFKITLYIKKTIKGVVIYWSVHWSSSGEY